MKTGMDKTTGKSITGIEYLKQRLSDVINTPKGSVVGRRDFGSRLHELVDRNVTSIFQMDAFVLIADAINDTANGLEDFKLSEMTVERVATNHIEINLTGTYLPTSEKAAFNLTFG